MSGRADIKAISLYLDCMSIKFAKLVDILIEGSTVSSKLIEEIISLMLSGSNNIAKAMLLTSVFLKLKSDTCFSSKSNANGILTTIFFSVPPNAFITLIRFSVEKFSIPITRLKTCSFITLAFNVLSLLIFSNLLTRFAGKFSLSNFFAM